MTSQDMPARKLRSGRRLGIMLAGAAALVIVLAVTLVLILAGGNKTGDGNGRNQPGTQTTVASTNDTATGAGGPVR